MVEEITRKDWEDAIKIHGGHLVNSKIGVEIHSKLLEFFKEKLKDFPEEDPMPEEIKEIVKK